MDRYFSGETLGIRLLAVGDINDSTEIIIWVEFHNLENRSKRIEPRLFGLSVDGGEARPPRRSCWSVAGERASCGGREFVQWMDPVEKIPLVEPYSTVSCWVVFWLEKREFEGMKRLEITYPGLGQAVDVMVSPSRRSQMTYLTMISPHEGQEVAVLRSVKFRLVEQYSPFNWTIEVDGKPVFTGRAEPELHWVGSFRFACPTIVDVQTESLNLARGRHRVAVYVFDGATTETASASFVVQPTDIGLLSPRWVLNLSQYLLGKVFCKGELSGQTVYDIDHDGSKEIIFSNERGESKRLWCIDSGLRLEWVYPAMDQEGLPGPTSRVSLVDLNGDGAYEICFASRQSLHVLNKDGRLVWGWDGPTGAAIRGAPQAYDVDRDGFVEFYLQDNAGHVYCVDREGRLIGTSQIGKGWMQPTIADIDRDGTYEVLAAGGDTLHCLAANGLLEKWRYNAGALMDATQIMVADIDGDGAYEALAWTSHPGSVVCVSRSGEELWRWRLPRNGTTRLCQAMGDLDRDGSMDMVVMSDVGIFCLDVGGVSPILKWEADPSRWSADGLIPDGARADYFSSSQLIADVDGDGSLEVLLLVPFPVVVDAATGVLEAYYFNEHIVTGIPQSNGAWWGDVDGDKRSEWICELLGWTNERTVTYCLTLDGAFPAESPWPEYWHSALPAPDQLAANWLTLKAAYSNSLWFPIGEGSWVMSGRSIPAFPGIALIGALAGLLLRRR